MPLVPVPGGSLLCSPAQPCPKLISISSRDRSTGLVPSAQLLTAVARTGLIRPSSPHQAQFSAPQGHASPHSSPHYWPFCVPVPDRSAQLSCRGEPQGLQQGHHPHPANPPPQRIVQGTSQRPSGAELHTRHDPAEGKETQGLF